MNDEIIQWCVRAGIREGEDVRRKLIAEGKADRSLRPRAENGYLLIPVLEETDFQAAFAPTTLHEELPRHEQIGGIVVLQEEDAAGAEKILAARPSLLPTPHFLQPPPSKESSEQRHSRYSQARTQPKQCTMNTGRD